MGEHEEWRVVAAVHRAVLVGASCREDAIRRAKELLGTCDHESLLFARNVPESIEIISAAPTRLFKPRVL